jgi:hypothetical protein
MIVAGFFPEGIPAHTPGRVWHIGSGPSEWWHQWRMGGLEGMWSVLIKKAACCRDLSDLATRGAAISNHVCGREERDAKSGQKRASARMTQSTLRVFPTQ